MNPPGFRPKTKGQSIEVKVNENNESRLEAGIHKLFLIALIFEREITFSDCFFVLQGQFLTKVLASCCSFCDNIQQKQTFNLLKVETKIVEHLWKKYFELSADLSQTQYSQQSEAVTFDNTRNYIRYNTWLIGHVYAYNSCFTCDHPCCQKSHSI